jgi:hypothetical protein
MKKKIKVVLNIGYGLFLAAGIAAKIRKDIATHAEHEEHNPCSCEKQCLRCLI